MQEIQDFPAPSAIKCPHIRNERGIAVMRPWIVALLALFALSPSLARSAPTWQTILSEAGRRIEIDRANMKREEGGRVVVQARLVMERPVNDPASGGSYRIVESLTRYECLQRNSVTLKRIYRKSETEVLREEEPKNESLPVRAGTLDEKVLREVCRPETPASAQETVDKAKDADAQVKAANRALIEKEKARTAGKTNARVVARRPAGKSSSNKGEHAHPTGNTGQHAVHWGYSGEGAPENWHKLDPRYKLCGSGQRQSPIDIRDGIRVDLEPIQFNYRPVLFRIADNGHSIEAAVGAGSITVTGKTYDLFNIHFHRPSEEMVNGKRFEMTAHLVHKSDEGQLAVVAVLFDKGAENPFVQMLWNNIPLEKNAALSPPGVQIDPTALLPASRGYYTFMGSLTTPPCTEGVLWLVMKQPAQVSQEQIDIFTRFYIHNARPVQPVFGRIIKESR